MENNNPKKSKAFIITFILILILLIVGYYLFKNRDQIFGTKGSTSVSKIFSPLFGSSKDKDLQVIDEVPKVNTTGTTPAVNAKPKITGTIITDANGNKIIMAEAGEMLKKGDVLYIAGFNKSNQPIVMKAIASDKNKSLVFGVAGEDMEKGKLGNIIIEGILSGVPTNRKEGTLWKANNPLYLSDKVYGGMTKNPPKSPSLIVPVGSVIKVHAIDGSIRIGKISDNTNISNKQKKDYNYLNYQLINSQNNSEFINSSTNPNFGDFSWGDLRDYLDSIFDYDFSEFEFNNPEFPPINPIDIPDFIGRCQNTATNYPVCTTKDGVCLNGATNPDLCTDNIKNVCKNGATNYPTCTTKDGICLNGAKNPDLCTNFTDITNPNNTCINGATNYPTCTTKDGVCLNGATNPDLCTNFTDITNPTAESNKCLLIEQNPLTFTPEEKARLAVLLRKFYLVSSTLKTSDDISTIYNEIDQQKNFIEQIQGLTAQCYSQITVDMMTKNNWIRHGNPWYTEKSGGTFPYTNENRGYLNTINTEDADTERILNIW